jgi:hypothetical protein
MCFQNEGIASNKPTLFLKKMLSSFKLAFNLLAPCSKIKSVVWVQVHLDE